MNPGQQGQELSVDQRLIRLKQLTPLPEQSKFVYRLQCFIAVCIRANIRIGAVCILLHRLQQP